MVASPLAPILDDFRREPSRTGSLIITFYGDAILPRGGSVWLGTLLRFLELLGIDGGVGRTAVSRLASEGWLESTKVGRKSFYRLAPAGGDRFLAAVAHVYDGAPARVSGGFDVLLIGNGADRAQARSVLFEAGYGSPLPGVWLAPVGSLRPALAEGAIALSATTDDVQGRALVEASWPLADLAASYRGFLKTFSPLREASARGQDLDPDDAIVARIMLIHHYRRAVLRDPLLPPRLLPADWPAGDARACCGEIYAALRAASEQWLDANGESAQGALPKPGKALTQRFIDMLQK